MSWFVFSPTKAHAHLRAGHRARPRRIRFPTRVVLTGRESRCHRFWRPANLPDAGTRSTIPSGRLLPALLPHVSTRRATTTPSTFGTSRCRSRTCQRPKDRAGYSPAPPCSQQLLTVASAIGHTHDGPDRTLTREMTEAVVLFSSEYRVKVLIQSFISLAPKANHVFRTGHGSPKSFRFTFAICPSGRCQTMPSIS